MKDVTRTNQRFPKRGEMSPLLHYVVSFGPSLSLCLIPFGRRAAQLSKLTQKSCGGGVGVVPLATASTDTCSKD